MDVARGGVDCHRARSARTGARARTLGLAFVRSDFPIAATARNAGSLDAVDRCSTAIRPRRRPGGGRQPAPLQGDTRLLGVFAERNGEGYALFRLADRGPVLVRTGQDVAKDVRLEVGAQRRRAHSRPWRNARHPVAPASRAAAAAPDRGATAWRREPLARRPPAIRARLQAQCRAADRHRVADGQLESAAGRGQRRASPFATTAVFRRCSACVQAIG